MKFTPSWYMPGMALKSVGAIQIAKNGFPCAITGKWMKTGTAFRFIRWGVEENDFGRAELKNLNQFLVDIGEKELPGEVDKPDLFTEPPAPVPMPSPCYTVPHGKEYQVVQGDKTIWTCRNQAEALGAAKCLTAIAYRSA